MPGNPKKNNKQSEGKSITIELEVHNSDDEGEKLTEQGNLRPVWEDDSKDNSKDEDFQVEEEEPEVKPNNEMEEIDEEEEGEDQSSNTESEPESSIKTHVRPNISEDEDMVPCSPMSSMHDESYSLELALLDVNPDKKKLDTPKRMAEKTKKTNKESEGKGITIDLEEIHDLEEEDDLKDNSKDEEFQVEEDEPEVNPNNEMEEMDAEEEEEDESRNTENEPESSIKSPIHPNISEDENMVSCSPMLSMHDENSKMEGMLHDTREKLSTLEQKNEEQERKIQLLRDAVNSLCCIMDGIMKSVVLVTISGYGIIKKNKKKVAKEE
ncbi:uncharacterized protein LOC131063674 [Cryptomeria japonica]|uniref:uncharacterized protein LOC131063674 n=1 Tax=Cryptomeria japonica TaxID=3369 RepID=UPI0027D9DA12|nr:uncharacterized protein LOC131063674 [Cryptomeria japonica]